MQLHASWKALFASITSVNEAGDCNLAGFTGAMDLEASLGEKLSKLVQPFGLLLAANDEKGISILHHPHNFGGTLLCPSNKVGCLVGVGSSAVPVVIDHDGALCPITTTVPTIAAIAACDNIDDLAALPTPSGTTEGAHAKDTQGNDLRRHANDTQGNDHRRGGQQGNNAGHVGPAVGGVATATNLNALACFIPTPFLRNTVLAADSTSPLELVIAARSARDAHVNAHEGEEGFNEGDVDAHVDLFSLWCLGVHQGKVTETCFSLAPDNGKLADWSAHLHRKDILPRVATAGTFPAPSEDTAVILRSLAAGISRTSEEAENQKKIQREQLDYLKAKDAKKKNKAEKWHHTSRRLVINAASTDGDSPADKIPETYLPLINSETTGMADKELQAQMSGLGYADAGFAHGLAASLYVGDILWNNRTTPSNLSPFTVFELDPLSTQQSTRCLQLHLLSKNTEGKSMEEIKTSQIQEVKVPTTFEELHLTLLFYSGITSILFGPKSALVAGTKSFALMISSEKIIFKGRIAADRELPEKNPLCPGNQDPTLAWRVPQV
jgi:hypothetical protein